MVVDPAKIMAPVLLVRGEHDGIASEEDLLDFYRLLPNPDRQFAVMPGAAHALVFGHNRPAMARRPRLPRDAGAAGWVMAARYSRV